MILSNLKRLYIKLTATVERILRVLAWMPVRLFRFFRHFASGINAIFKRKNADVPAWWLDFTFYLADLLLVPEIYETFMDFVKWKTRPLSPLEQQLARSVFGDSVKLNAVRIDNSARIGCRKNKIAYVSFFTVNSWGKLTPATFIHELVHVWQYQQIGSAYISRALRAQRSKAGYNYGGVQALYEAKIQNGKIGDFNLEQQAEIVSDYYAIRENSKPVWGNATDADLPTYQYFVKQIRT